jgi:hypothetical protein
MVVVDESRTGISYVEAEHRIALPEPISGAWIKQSSAVERARWDSVTAAVSWGRERAPIVELRLKAHVFPMSIRRVGTLGVRLLSPPIATTDYFQAGVQTGALEHPWRRWPGTTTELHGRLDGYGGVVRLAARMGPCSLEPLPTFQVSWEAPHDGVMVCLAREGGLSEVQAVDWGRKRAPVVLVCYGAVEFEYFSAGADHLADLEIPAWEDRWPITGADARQGPGSRTRRAGRSFPLSY